MPAKVNMTKFLVEVMQVFITLTKGMKINWSEEQPFEVKKYITRKMNEAMNIVLKKIHHI